ncbi:MAG TPA: enoyl-CoA hydratase-related protein, partial [Paracoccus sp. (in: a-proteobacteria)]|nr:enoyl-CoA hydratase-related protein [Paracoccus sp. (in: a-proteobacteria)]
NVSPPTAPDTAARLVGPSRAAMILMAGQKIEATEALAWGLTDRIVPGDALIESAEALAADAIGASPGHVAGIKRLLAAP